MRDYLRYLTKAKLTKEESNDPCLLLTYLDIQDTIDFVNSKKSGENQSK